jgi:Carboxypeptidase regulatory-like domain/TonB-dependent Receptor Plug Domain/TonB dependent receptor
MSFKTFRLILALPALISLNSSPVRAQVAGAALTGTITDATGGAIANAQILAKNLSTDLVTSTTTNSDGFYSIPNLLPGDYQITISAPGFGTKQTAITLTVGAKQVLNLPLAVGQAQQVVQVTEQAPTIQLATSTISENVEGAEVRELPLNGRDWAALATLQPGVASVRTQEQVTQVGSHARGLGMQLTIGGARPTQNTYRLNGVVINDYSNAGPGSVLGQNLGVDAIQEFSVLTSNYSAEYGFTSGGVINAITRSGTNQFHGSVYEFFRNSALDAADFFENANGLKKAAFRRNQFGGSGGGPIWKDKIYIFGDYEGLRQSKGISHTAHTLSPNARLGILNDGAAAPGSCPGSSVLPTPKSNACVDPVIAKFFTFYPVPNAGLIGPGDTGNYAFSGAQVVPENYYTFRGDVKVSDKDSLNASYYYDRSSFTQPDALNQVQDQFIVGRQGGAVEETHIFSPQFSNTLRLGYSRSYGDGQLTPKAINPAAADGSFGMLPGFFAPRINPVGGLTGFQGGLRGQSVQNYTQQTFQEYDDAVRNIGTHNLKFGGSLIRLHEDLFAPFTEDGNVTFSSLRNFLANVPLRASPPPDIAALSPHYNRDWIVGLYVQDDWKMRSNLTLNLGLRYEMATIPSEKYGRIANLPTIETDPGAGVFNHFYFPHNPTTKNFEPRIGFAWDPFHNGRTAVRGGFGLFDALPLPYELVINNAQTSPFHVAPILSNPPPGSFPFQIPALTTSPPPAAQVWNYVDTNIKRNYVYQYNLNIQHQFIGNTTLTVAYAGSRGIHNPFQTDEINTVFPFKLGNRWLFPNPVCSGPTPAASCLTQGGSAIVPGHPINTNVAEIQTTLWQSMSYYNALQMQVQKQLSHGLQITGSFTWSKTMDTSSGSFAGDNFAADVTPTIPWWDLRITRGLSDFNVGRNLTLNVLYELPAMTSFHGPASWLVSGWQVGTILQASDGVPLWPLDGLEGDPMGQLNSEPLAIPDRIPGCKLSNPGNPNQYINANCLTNAQAPSAAFYTANCDKSFPAPTCINLLGNLGRNAIIGPGLINVDFSLVKNTKVPKISENFNVQFRAEFFNILNHPNFAPPVNNLEAFDPSGNLTPGFGQITNLQVPSREIQFALKFLW